MLRVGRKRLAVYLAAVVLLAIVAVAIFTTKISASAEDAPSDSIYSFSVVQNEDGSQSYSVSVKAAAKPTLEFAVIPKTYNGLPVTQIANNGFMGCKNLNKVLLPNTIKAVGNNAFLNCPKLERVNLPMVESIGSNALALCPQLSRVYIPNTVKTVGANILRNNSNTLYVQRSVDEIGEEWQSTWSSYFTGDIVYGVEPEDTVGYREISDENDDTIGYEISEYQWIIAEDSDVVIYNSFRPNDEEEYLPVLNICSEAFTFSQVNSVTIRDRREVDPSAPEFTHKINVRSNAFIAFQGNEAVFEVGLTFDHPAQLQNTNISMYDDCEIVGDINGNSIKIFEASTISSVTLSADIEFLPERMFYDCSYLQEIKYFGSDYDGVNHLNNVKKIGTGAFSSCVNLSELIIPSTVTEVGERVFDYWGYGEYSQAINIDFYEGYLPVGWADNWFGGNPVKTTVNYKEPTYITIDWQANNGTETVIGVKPDLEMPAIEVIERAGYAFKGIYSEKDGFGLQYYTDKAAVRAPWKENEPTTIYAYWSPINYDIIYPEELSHLYNPNPKTYTVEDEIVLSVLEDEAYYYYFIPDVIERGTAEEAELSYYRKPRDFLIAYEVDDWKGCVNPNKIYLYTVEEEVVFINLECEGYTFAWQPASIPAGSTDNITVKGVWTPNTYNIRYFTAEGTKHSNPTTYTYGQELVLLPATRGGYFVSWDKPSIPAGTIGDVSITLISVEKTLDQCFNGVEYEIWTCGQLEQLADQPNGGSGRTYILMNRIWKRTDTAYYCKSISEFRGILDGNGFDIANYTIDHREGGNIGFCKINYGIIKNLRLAVRYSVPTDFANVNVGSFAGINRGTIQNCYIYSAFPRPAYRCNALGESNAGCFVGVNEGTITDCTGGERIYGYCNMGIVAGKNAATIKNCAIGNGICEVRLDCYRDYNASVGGIVGLQVSGAVYNCSYYGRVTLSSNYQSKKYDKQFEDREMQPCMGIIVGYLKGGAVSNNTWECPPDTYDGSIVFTDNEPYIVTWKSGGKTYKHDQGLYIRNEECGRDRNT